MLGTIIGDIAGSRFEFNNIRNKDFELFAKNCHVTDDSIMTLAVAKAILACNGNWEQLGNNAVKYMQEFGRKYPDCGFSSMFKKWLFSDNPIPYNSYGNGAAMRVSPCGFIARTEEEAALFSRKVTEVTHNHTEGLKGAEAVSIAIFMAKNGAPKNEIKERIEKDYYALNFTLDSIRESYEFDVTCQGTVPQAIEAFLESVSFEDAVRNAVSIGGDSDTLAAITGSIAEAYYGVPLDLICKAQSYLNRELRGYYWEWERHISKVLPVRKFIYLTKYTGKLEDVGYFNQFYIEFYNYVQSHPEYELGEYENILEENDLSWETHSMRAANENNLDEQCILALITGVFRADHFSRGVLSEFIKDGYIDKWLGRLKVIDKERKPEKDKPVLKNVKICLYSDRKGMSTELLITDKQITIKSNTHDGGNITHQYEHGDLSEIGELCLNAMGDCLDAEGWNDANDFNEPEFTVYLYELNAEYEDGKTISHHGLFNRVHIPEKAFKAFMETVRFAINVYGFGGIVNLDGFMNAIKPGEVKYCGVKFSNSGCIYHYRTTDLRIDVGDIVIVPVGDDNHEQEVTVKTVDYCRWDDTPYPLEKTKQILRKAGDKSNSKPLLHFSANTPLLQPPDELFINHEDEEAK
jgi:ADP-ribosylglycohydrolase